MNPPKVAHTMLKLVRAKTGIADLYARKDKEEADVLSRVRSLSASVVPAKRELMVSFCDLSLIGGTQANGVCQEKPIMLLKVNYVTP